MKKIIILLCIILWCKKQTQAQTTCATAQSLLTYINGVELSQTNKEQWYYFQAAYPDMFIDVLKTDTTFLQVDSVFIYSGSCSTTTLIASKGKHGLDSTYGMEVRARNLIVGQNYYIRIKLRVVPTHAIKFGFNMATTNFTGCNLITNGDFETQTALSPCGTPFPGPSISWSRDPGVFMIPSWETGGAGFAGIFSTNTLTCPPWSQGPPRSGFFMAPILSAGYGSQLPFGDYCTYIRTTFSSPMASSKKYYVQMFYRTDTGSLTTNGLGMYLSQGVPANVDTGTAYIYSHISPTCTPQFANPLTNQITNLSWLPMGGVYTAAGNEDHLTIGNFRPASLTTVVSPTITAFFAEQLLIDDVSITPLDFQLSSISICSGMSVAISPAACTPPSCTSTFTWVPAAGLSSTNTPNTIASPTVTTTYTLTQTITNAIGAITTNTGVMTITVTPATFTLTAGANSNVLCANLGQSAVTLTAASTGTGTTTYIWFPGGLLGATQAGLPQTVSTVYTVSAAYEGCTFTQTVGVNISTLCCTSTVGVISQANLNGATITGPAVINQDINIGGNAISTFQGGEFLIAPNVNINILSGSQLQLKGVHLYACRNAMWQGINVNINARLVSAPTSTNTTLIEDAITAVNINNINSVPTLSLVEVNGAIFNKNYVAIKINNSTSNVVPTYLVSNVFTCRSLTFTSTQWPSASSTATNGLRVANNPTTGLVPPYNLQSAAYSNLKNPYGSQSAFAGVMLTDVGNTTGNPSYGAELGGSIVSNSDYFNVFDGLNYGIYAINSNVKSYNNVFQNMQAISGGTAVVGGTGIYSGCNTLMNNQLDLSDPFNDPSMSGGNRFWNCYYGVLGNTLYKFTAIHSLFRSTQSNTVTGSSILPGNTGVYLSSCRFGYYITNCNFNNLRYGINMGIVSGTYDIGSGPTSGIYEGNINIASNYFGAEPTSTTTIANEYMNTAVSVSSPNGIAWQSLANSGLFIQSNNMNRVYRAVSVNGMNSYTTTINTNSVVLVNDIMTGTNQHGIEVVNTLAKNVVLTNTVTGSGLTNTVTSLVFCGSNQGSGSPSVCCNILSAGYKGFEFTSSNSGTIWKGNNMINLFKGLVLSVNGVIGQQGASGVPSDNQWNSFAGGTFGTWTESGSNAVNSKLFINSLGGAWTPPNNSGTITSQSYGQVGNIVFTTGTAYACASSNAMPPAFLMVAPIGGGTDDQSEDMAYSSGSTLYRFLDANPAQLDSSQALSNFYDSVSVGSIGTFNQVESKLYNGQVSQAKALNSSVTATNNVEMNYQQYYRLYSHYSDSSFNIADSMALYNLAGLCPGSDGPCVYQARALYNLIYRTVLNVNDNCDQALQNGRRFNTNVPAAAKQNKAAKIQLFPNPTNGQLSIQNPVETDQLNVLVKDLSGRTVWNSLVQVQNYGAQFYLNLKEGMYMITLKNNANESVTKKLVIAN